MKGAKQFKLDHLAKVYKYEIQICLGIWKNFWCYHNICLCNQLFTQGLTHQIDDQTLSVNYPLGSTLGRKSNILLLLSYFMSGFNFGCQWLSVIPLDSIEEWCLNYLSPICQCSPFWCERLARSYFKHNWLIFRIPP